MNVVKCNNGHFFDKDVYEICPHCGETIAKADKEKKGLFGGKSKTGAFQIPKEPSRPKQVPDTEVTVALDSGAVSIGLENSYVNTTSAVNDINGSEPTIGIVNSEVSTRKVPDDISIQPSLRETIRLASANTEGKTMSYFSASGNRDSGANEQVSKLDTGNRRVLGEPVVGWLVCIGGKHFGESFQIGAGKNSIGRNNENRIVLDLDQSISREKHALITYEPKKRNFYLQPGDSSGLTYLNEEYITESKLLKEKDIIELGDTKLMLVPLCGEQFTWEDYINKE